MNDERRVFAVTASDEQLQDALESAHMPTLLAVIMQLSGDTSLMDSPIRPKVNSLELFDQSGGLTPEEEHQVRQKALAVLQSYRTNPRPVPPMPAGEMLVKMMSYVMGDTVPERYAQMLEEDLNVGAHDPKDICWERPPSPLRLRSFHVIVIGAGMSGLLAAIKLQRAGIPYTVIEKNAAIGGTWYENTYPGCGVDVESQFYSYSFEPNSRWIRYFAKQPELRAYWESCAAKYQVQPHIRFNTAVTGLRWDDAACVWRVTAERAGHGEEVFTANAVICAVGQLNRPKLPDIPGLDSFRGPAFHSSAWQHEHDLKGKRVAIIGNGASANQIVPAIAPEVGELRVFQRSPQWGLFNPNYFKTVTDGKRWLLEHVPGYQKWYRLFQFWKLADGLFPAQRIDPAWPHQDRSISEFNDSIRVAFTDYITQELAGDAQMLSKCLPDYPPFGKRILIDNGWWRTLRRDNVELVTDEIVRIGERSIVTSGGEHEVDVLVFATGFQPLQLPFEVRGRDGLALTDAWGGDPGDPRAYLGITLPGFPNFFFLYGPNTNAGTSASIIYTSELQVRYAMESLREMIEHDYAALDVRKEVHDAYNDKVDAALRTLVWSHPKVNSWYNRGPGGRVATNLAFPIVDYWEMTRRLNLADYEVLKPSAASPEVRARAGQGQ
jgi:4-hydroxyacetophenone monooxygenase